MIRVVFSAFLLAMVFTADAESFLEKFKNKFQKAIDKLAIPESLKKELLNSEEFKEMLKNIVDLDDFSVPDHVKEEMFNGIDFDEILKNVNLGGLPETTTASVLTETAKNINFTTFEVLKPFPTDLTNEIIVGGENSRLDDLTDRVENLEEDVQELKQQHGTKEDLTTTTEATDGCPKNFDRNPKNGHCYMFSRDRKDWQDAKEACSRLGAGLISIETEMEYDMILKYILHSFDSDDFYTSGNDKEEQFKFIWDTTGLPITFSAWAPEEPNNQYGNERCLEIKYYREYEKYYWNDLPCHYPKNYICEMPM